MAMVEIGYRYQELYLTGKNENWDYAEYQVEKINQSLQNALQRRPRREVSTQEIFMPDLERIRETIALKDKSSFDNQFTLFTASCNRCHVAEGVPSFVVIPPEIRTTPIK